CASIQSSSDASFGICLMGIDTGGKNWRPSYQLPKTPAVNPKTKQPWISISSEKVKDILSECGGKLSKEEIAYVKQLQYILNDNIHYFYGEQFVDLFGMSETERYKLSGRYAPVKLLMFDAFDSILPAEATQRRELSRYLGRPIYQLHKAWDIEKTAWEFPSSGAISTYITKRLVLKDGQKLGTVWYTASLRAAYIDPNHGLRLGQLGYVHVSLGQMSRGLLQLLEDNGVDAYDDKNNKTAMGKILFYLNAKTQNYINVICACDYAGNKDFLSSDVRAVRNQQGISDFEGYRSLSELVNLPADNQLQALGLLKSLPTVSKANWIGTTNGVSKAQIARIIPESDRLAVKTPEVIVSTATSSSAEQQLMGQQLLAACIAGKTDAVKQLIASKVDVDAATALDNATGFSPLIFAGMNGHKEIVAMLLAAGADPNYQSKRNKKTVLSEVMYKRQYDIVEMLIKAGAQIDKLIDTGSTVLGNCCALNDINGAALLIRHGANIRLKGSKGKSPLDYLSAAQRKNNQQLLMLSDADLIEEALPLEAAIKAGNAAEVKKLLEGGADPNEMTTLQEPMILFAVQGGNLEIIKLLIDYKVDVNTKLSTKYGSTPLILATEAKNKDMIILLLEAGANVDLKNNHLSSALTTAVLNNNIDLLELLLAKKPNQDVLYKMRDMSDGSLLHVACVTLNVFNRSDTSAVKLIIDEGYDTQRPDANGKTPLDYLPDTLRPEIEKYIEELLAF
ncbi:MAG: ankyrin repeat domain-containing protein, partial [Akkermansia sp.]